MSSSALQRTTKKKGDKLSKFLGIDSGPSTQLIADMQSRINNPLFKLSITDYEAMCGNKMMIKMMSKVIGCEEKQLKKFCKYINVFAENINSSPKFIKKKIDVEKNISASKRRGALNSLPDDVYRTIVDQYKRIFRIKYVLKSWIPIDKIDWPHLSSNPNAIDLLKANSNKIYWVALSRNPNAIELLQANPKKIDWRNLSTNPSAIEMLKENHGKINWGELSRNPNAIELLKANRNNINYSNLSENPSAIELIKNKINEENDMYGDLDNSKKINWKLLSSNTNEEVIELLQANPNNIDWKRLSANPNAIELLRTNPSKIDWDWLSENPNAIELLKANPDKINWYNLSANPSYQAIELLKENKSGINFPNLSANPSIFDEKIA